MHEHPQARSKPRARAIALADRQAARRSTAMFTALGVGLTLVMALGLITL